MPPRPPTRRLSERGTSETPTRRLSERGTSESKPATIRLRALLPSLKPAEARVARVFLEPDSGEPHPTISSVAARAETSTATVVRLFQRLGYRHFKAFWMDLTLDAHRDEAAGATTEATGDIDRSDSLPDIVAKVYTNSWLSLADTARTLDVGALAEAIELISGAARVDLFGAGAGAVVLHDLQQKLSRIGQTALFWPDTHAAWTAAAALPPGGVALGVSHSGETVDTVEFLRLARARGVRTIALTNHGESPITEHAEVVLLTAAREDPFRSGALGSRTAQLLVLDCLFIGVAQANYDGSMEALRETLRVLRSRR